MAKINHKDSISLKSYFDTKLEASDKALQLQEREYARRLDDLNHEAERLRNMQVSYLPREVYDVNHKELCAKLEKLEAFNNQLIGKFSIIAVLISIGISIIIYLITSKI